MIIGVTGPISSGKGKVAEFFKAKGFVHHSFSMTIRQIAKERGIEINRENLIKLGKGLREESPGDSIIGGRILAKIKSELEKGVSRWVLEGIRDSDEVNLFREHEFDNKKMRYVLVYVDALQKERFDRLRKRGRSGDPETFQKFKKFDDLEIKGNVGQELGKLKEMADYTILNDGTLEDMDKKLEKLWKEIQ